MPRHAMLLSGAQHVATLLRYLLIDVYAFFAAIAFTPWRHAYATLDSALMLDAATLSPLSFDTPL